MHLTRLPSQGIRSDDPCLILLIRCGYMLGTLTKLSLTIRDTHDNSVVSMPVRHNDMGKQSIHIKN